MDHTKFPFFLQWNCRGLRANLTDLKVLLEEHHPTAVCLQETLLLKPGLFKLRGFKSYDIFSDADGSSRGVSILTNNGIPKTQIPIKSKLHAVAIRISLSKTITLCSVYFPPNQNISSEDIESLISELPEPFIIMDMGDMNAHNPLWGDSRLDKRGKILEELILNRDICLFNHKSPTYIHRVDGSKSALDLSFCSPSLFLDFSWTVLDDLYGSDHYLTILASSLPETRKTIRNYKQSSWREYVSKLKSKTPMNKIWKMVRKISGKTSPQPIHLFSKNNSLQTSSVEETANIMGETFQRNSSSISHSDKFKKFKINAEKKPLHFSSDNSETYNLPFSMQELISSLDRVHDTSPGPDKVHYQMLKHLPITAQFTLLNIFNTIWTSGFFPTSLHKATIIPLPKPGKDDNDPNNYRPIALTSCICKTMERMVNDRLVWFLEKEQILSQSQSGFRKRRSTVDQLIKLETLARESFIQGHHGVAVFFDLEKAYDTTWKYGIMKDLHFAGLRGRLPEFISSFLNDRHFRVRIGAILSDEYEQEMGVPQGCILSVTLFCLKINSIVKTLLPDTECSLYKDDFLIFFHSRHMPIIERHLQRVLNKLQVWADENGFKFSTSKTVVMHFCRMKKEHSHPELFLNGTALPVVEETKFLGLIFDSKLTFIPHLKYLRKKCLQAINLLRVVGHYD